MVSGSVNFLESDDPMKRVNDLSIFIIAVVVCLIIPAGMKAQNWPMVNACKERNSWAEGEIQLSPPLQKSMEFILNGEYASRMSYYADMLYVSVTADTNKVLAFNAQEGTETWKFPIPNARASVGFVPTVCDSLLLCGGQHALGLYALDRFTGKEEWYKAIGSLNYRHAVIDGNRIYVVGDDSLFCLHAQDGSTLWSYAFSRPASPVVDEEKIYFCGDREIIVLDKLNGDTILLIENSQRWYGSIAIDDHQLYTYHNESIVALQKDSAALVWAYPIPGKEFPQISTNAIAISDSYLCFAIQEDTLHRGQLYALDKSTGDYRWHFNFDTVGVYSPTIANGNVYAVCWTSGTLWGFDLETGQKVFHDSTEKYLGQPIVGDGRLFVEAYGKVIAFENQGTGTDPISVQNERPSELLHSWPNPFRHAIQVEFRLRQPDHIRLSVYDLAGKRVRTLTDRSYEAGSHILTWDGSNESQEGLPAGLYILRLEGVNSLVSCRLMLLE
jgi:outer membrane protein assembly factor BamB